MGSVAAAAVEAARATEGLKAAQALADRVARLPSPGGDFWRAAVKLEAEAAAASGVSGSSSAIAQVSPSTSHCGGLCFGMCWTPMLGTLSVTELAPPSGRIFLSQDLEHHMTELK